MSPIAIGAIVVVYAIVACLVMAIWTRIPPRTTLYDALLGIVWPFTLPLMVCAAFINATVRAIEDQTGEFAGINKAGKWYAEQKRRRDA